MPDQFDRRKGPYIDTANRDLQVEDGDLVMDETHGSSVYLSLATRKGSSAANKE